MVDRNLQTFIQQSSITSAKLIVPVSFELPVQAYYQLVNLNENNYGIPCKSAIQSLKRELDVFVFRHAHNTKNIMGLDHHLENKNQ